MPASSPLSLALRFTTLALSLAALPCACGSSDDANAGAGALGACAFFDDADNCFVRLSKEASTCVGDAYSLAKSGALSADGLLCTSTDAAVTTTFAKPVASQDGPYDVTVKRGDALCFRYRGQGSGSTPATFASATINVEMTSDPSTGDLVVACEGKSFRGSLFTQCAGTKVIPSVSTSYGASGSGKLLSMSLPLGPTMYSCKN